MTPIHLLRISHPFQGEGDPLRTQGEGSHPFVGGRDESPKEGWGDRDESSKRGVSQVIRKGRVPREAPPITAKGRGWGANYVNVGTKCLPFYSPHEDFFKLLVFPKLIMLIL